ncbi:hypothetical protein V8Z80_08350 [Orrella sp. JC864]|uniref:hypothetical protein n=1 Tax=Orrella sp. JC864 TaxID=3120298 RepID=UPI003008AC11
MEIDDPVRRLATRISAQHRASLEKYGGHVCDRMVIGALATSIALAVNENSLAPLLRCLEKPDADP